MVFPEAGGGNNEGAGWGFKKMSCSSDGSTLTLGETGLKHVLSGDVEVAPTGLVTGFAVAVSTEVVDAWFD